MSKKKAAVDSAIAASVVLASAVITSPYASATQGKASGTVVATLLFSTGVKYMASGRNTTILDLYDGIGAGGKGILRVGLHTVDGVQFTTTREIGPVERNIIATNVLPRTAFGIYYRSKETLMVNGYWEGTLWY